MSKPLAEVLCEAHLKEMGKGDTPVALYRREYLAMADAAITHLGAGYRLPEVTEVNAERLAKAKHAIDYPDSTVPVSMEGFTLYRLAADWLEALHAAFGEAEKLEPSNCPDAAGYGSSAATSRRQAWSVNRPKNQQSE